MQTIRWNSRARSVRKIDFRKIIAELSWTTYVAYMHSAYFTGRSLFKCSYSTRASDNCLLNVDTFSSCFLISASVMTNGAHRGCSALSHTSGCFSKATADLSCPLTLALLYKFVTNECIKLFWFILGPTLFIWLGNWKHLITFSSIDLTWIPCSLFSQNSCFGLSLSVFVFAALSCFRFFSFGPATTIDGG